MIVTKNALRMLYLCRDESNSKVVDYDFEKRVKNFRWEGHL